MASLLTKNNPSLQTATFAGGCFWCMEPPFRKLAGVQTVISGYMGGKGINPTYQDYALKGHLEVIQITFDPTIISYKDLLETFWRNIDPTDAHGQFADQGRSYRSAIFYHSAEQKTDAEHSKEKLIAAKQFSKPIVTEILPAMIFYPAEEYHQDYARKNRARYEDYRVRSGRDQFLAKHWEDKKQTPGKKYTKDANEELAKRLTPLQYKVTQECSTEPPFKNEYYAHKEPGIYVDIVSGEPLFSSLDKYDSGTGWPSFKKPLESKNIIEKKDETSRIEVRSKQGDSHLGHVFNDGPMPTGLRYCMNSASLRFIPVKDLEKEGYGEYLKLFKK